MRVSCAGIETKGTGPLKRGLCARARAHADVHIPLGCAQVQTACTGTYRGHTQGHPGPNRGTHLVSGTQTRIHLPHACHLQGRWGLSRPACPRWRITSHARIHARPSHSQQKVQKGAAWVLSRQVLVTTQWGAGAQGIGNRNSSQSWLPLRKVHPGLLTNHFTGSMPGRGWCRPRV